MQHLQDSIKQSLSNKNWYSAIAIALTIPDICSTINDGKQSNGKKYAGWFDKYVGVNYRKEGFPDWMVKRIKEHGTEEHVRIALSELYLTGNDCYALRCAFLHEGKGSIIEQRAREILDEIKFVEPNGQFVLHKSIQNNKIILHIDLFCNHILEGIEEWIKQLSTEQKYRLKSFLKVKNIFDVIKE